ncbi:MAG: hypothetical protein EOP66_16540 [Sphingomonas sp.]|nr:MAG: hypothetical protein EOP66_16540 [Sphingomonas sp.]
MPDGGGGRGTGVIAVLPLRHLRRHLPLAGEDFTLSASPNSLTLALPGSFAPGTSRAARRSRRLGAIGGSPASPASRSAPRSSPHLAPQTPVRGPRCTDRGR